MDRGSRPTGGLRPPPGVTPNFVNPDSLRPYFIVTFAVCVTVTSIFVLIRVYTKTFIAKSQTWEDCEDLNPPPPPTLLLSDANMANSFCVPVIEEVANDFFSLILNIKRHFIFSMGI